ncbi:hypothetical protein [Acidisphaera sp. L21]|uniref:phosphorylase family protein n=1 Tax=Acidisphaera sp. L21 TaxID=1641851 RepID=UPI00131E53D0|nr:hypothetical protein [Acidisphaera sp. L21]
MLGVVVGLVAEARIARGLGIEVAVGGGDAAGAAVAANRLAESGVTGLISFGLAGGLSPELAAGLVIVPEGVVAEDGTLWRANPALAARLGVAGGLLLAASAIIGTRQDKFAAWRRTGASAADLESGAVARVAAEHGLPFAVLRAICDPADRDLPPAAMTALDANGRIRPAALLRSLARHPGQISGLIALGREAASARTALLARVAAIGPLA